MNILFSSPGSLVWTCGCSCDGRLLVRLEEHATERDTSNAPLEASRHNVVIGSSLFTGAARAATLHGRLALGPGDSAGLRWRRHHSNPFGSLFCPCVARIAPSS